MARWTDLATWKGTDSHGGPMASHRGLVVHIAEGFYDGTISWQQHGAKAPNRVSSHFIVGRNGQCAQMVDTANESWCQKAGNADWLSVECEGFTPASSLHKTHPGWEKLTPEQIETIARLLLRGHRDYGYALTLATSPSGHGLGHHSMGKTWGHQDCPGPAIIGQKPAILARAVKLSGPTTPETLKVGSRGARVVALQKRCNAVPDTGADVATDGDYGPKTKAKVERVQAHFHIHVDGQAGPVTQGKLGM